MMKIAVVTDKDYISFNTIADQYLSKIGVVFLRSWLNYDIHPDMRDNPVFVDIIENVSGYFPIHGMKVIEIPDDCYWKIDSEGSFERLYISKSPILLMEE